MLDQKQIGNQQNLTDNYKYSSYGYSPIIKHFDHLKINSWVANFGAAVQLTYKVKAHMIPLIHLSF